MTTLAHSASSSGFMGWLARTEAWLDAKGKPAWMIAMILGFVFVWPVGLALLGYIIWSKKMFSTSKGSLCRHRITQGPINRPTGNAAFDAYKSETLQRLQREQENFEAFLQRLRDARDKAEFDQFMEDRAKSPATEAREATETSDKKDA